MALLPRPKSPPELYGKRRESAKVAMLEREIGFLEEELKTIEKLRPASSCIKEVADYVVTTPEPLITICRRSSKSCGFWKWLLCGKSCFDMSCLCCRCCSGSFNGCCSLEIPPCCCCSLPQGCCSWSMPKCTCAIKPPSCPAPSSCSCSPNCNSSCCRCKFCWPVKCSCSCSCTSSCWPTKCSCWPTKCSCPKLPKCSSCSLENNCCYSSYFQCCCC